MRTLILEGIVRAKTAISHNGGEVNGNIAAFRRMKVIQPDGNCIEVPHISGNSIRGKLRDIAAKHMLDLLGEDGNPHKVNLQVFHLLFSGGALTGGNTDGDIDKFKEMRDNLPHLSLFGGAYGNAILPGKMKVNPLIPIAQETAHILPSSIRANDLPSVFTYLNLVMHTRSENSKDPEFQPYIERTDEDSSATNQMIYHIETLAAGTPFYWKVILEDVTPQEFDFFISVVQQFKRIPIVGGKGAVGFGQIDLENIEWRDITKEDESLTINQESTKSLYVKMMSENKGSIRGILKKMEL